MTPSQKPQDGGAVMTRYEPHCDCLGGHVSMRPDPNGRWCRAAEGWQDISTAPKGVLMLTRRANGRIDVAKLYDNPFGKKNTVIDEWSGRWWTAIHWAPIPTTEADHA